jgi:aspartyl-tRNA(Asn)/glutamyl-tRNA(Gln) amidotransferase subunit C
MLTREEVIYVASLSRIHLEESEILPLQKDLAAILDYIDKLKKLDVKGIPPTSHVLPLKNVYREDVPKPSLKQPEALGIALSQEKSCFKVPPVIE